ncbi:Ig-like domain-containing protein [Aliikangiella sp. G2MR2-5]|uniref:Ig-like domain-containing protein n=1 Tax=Aliikangiella sp. G2MR2-5 TaxID=2788943 RepID=UPI0018AC5AC3|nr:Ig-like domain-containing protein [Aliikangiella sp. G2MR2-5]
MLVSVPTPTLIPENPTISVGRQLQLQVSGLAKGDRVTWASSNTSIVDFEKVEADDPATVHILGRSPGVATIQATIIPYQGKSFILSNTVTVSMPIIKINPAELRLWYKKRNSLDVVTIDTDIEFPPILPSAVWSSSNPDIVMVQQDGTVSGESVGKAVITALIQFPSGQTISASSNVEVIIPSLKIDTSTNLIFISGVKQLGAYLYDPKEIPVVNKVSVRPSSWLSQFPSNLQISSEGKIRGLHPGSSLITASFQYFNEVLMLEDSQLFSTRELPALDMSPKESLLTFNSTQAFTVDVFGGDDFEWEMEWFSADPEIASIDAKSTDSEKSSAIATALYSGRTTITARMLSPEFIDQFPDKEILIEETATLTSYDPENTYIEIRPPSINLENIGDTAQLVAFTHGYKGEVEWVSTNPEAVTVDEYGIVTLQPGANGDGIDSATIMASFKNPDVIHVPGNSLALGTHTNPEAIRIDGDYLPPGEARVEYIDTETDASIEMDFYYSVLDDYPDIGAGKVLITPKGSMVLNRYEVSEPGVAYTFYGRLPKMTEIYEDLDLSPAPEEITTRLKFYEEKSHRSIFNMEFNSSSATATNQGKSAGCDLRLDFEIGKNAEFRFKVKNGVLAAAHLYTGISAVAKNEPYQSSTSVECSIDIIKPTAIIGWPIPQVFITVVETFYIKAAAGIEVSVNTLEVPTPEFTTSAGGSGEMNYDGETGFLDFFASNDPATFDPRLNFLDVLPNTAAEIDRYIGLKAGLKTFVLWGVHSVVPLTTRVILGPEWADAALVGITIPEFEPKLGYKKKWFTDSVLPVTHPYYQGPEGELYGKVTFTAVKNIETGKILKWFIALLGGQAEIRNITEPKDLFELGIKLPEMYNLTATESKIYFDGDGSQYPKQTTFNWELTPYWNMELPLNAGIPLNKIEVWRRKVGSGNDNFELVEEVMSRDSWTFVPESTEQGEWVYRFLIYRNPWLVGALESYVKPWASAEVKVEVLSVPVLALSATPAVISALPNTTTELQVYVVNTGTGDLTFGLNNGGYSFIEVPDDQFELPGTLATLIPVSVTCPNQTTTLEGRIESIDQANRHSSASITLHCEIVSVYPRSANKTGKVGSISNPNFPDWVDETFHLKNTTETSVDVTTTSDLTLSGSHTLTLQPGEHAVFEAGKRCWQPGKTTHTITVTAGGFDSVVPFTINCVPPGDSDGDPHLVNFSNTKFDFQAAGEFVLSKAGDGPTDFQVQVRQVPWENRNVTVNSAVAMNVHGQRVGLYTPEEIPNGGAELMVDGIPVLLEVGEEFVLANGSGPGKISRLNDNQYLVVWEKDQDAEDPTAASVLVKIYRRAPQQLSNMDIGVTPYEADAELLTGVLGNWNNLANDDFKLRNGDQIEPPLSFEQLYDCSSQDCFAYGNNGWIIQSSNESLFDYKEGMGPFSYAPAEGTIFPATQVTLDDLDPEQRDWAESVCRTAGVVDPDLLQACIIDVALTGIEDFAQSAANQEISPAADNSSCKTLKASGANSNGNYFIDPDGDGNSIEVYCDMTTGEGGWTFLHFANGIPSTYMTDNDSCKAVGLQIFAPRSKQDYELGKSYVRSIGQANKMGPLGVYNTVNSTQNNRAVAAENLPMNTYSPNNASEIENGWVSTAGANWWMSDASDVDEPNGDYTANSWLGSFAFDPNGYLTWYNDEDNGYYTYSSYLCMHEDNLTLSH